MTAKATTWDPWGRYPFHGGGPVKCAPTTLVGEHTSDFVVPVPANDNETAPRVVAFTGVAGSGKSTATRYMESKGYQLVKFAGPLKRMLRAIGLTDEELEGQHKESPRDILCGKTPRHAMQTLGTEWGRKCLGDDFWLNLWKLEVEGILAAGGRAVCDDCRFPNEAAAIRHMGGDIYRLVGRGGLAGSHESECQDFLHDCLIENYGPLADLHERIERAMRRYN